jgi:hypothetical protein
MDYRAFKKFRAEILAADPALIDASDLDLYGKFPSVETIFTDISGGHKGSNIHRCHLVEDFLRAYQLDGIESPNAVDKGLISFSSGVRESLSILMKLFNDKQWLLPSDNYPYYLTEAEKQNVSFALFDTLEKKGLSELVAGSNDADILLVTYPLKPSGMEYTAEDGETLRSWLAVNPERRVILDAVYLFELHEEHELFALFHETRQVIILYSLSKAFAAPLVAGFTFSYDPFVREAFKSIERNEERMRLAYLLLNKDEGIERRESVLEFVSHQHFRAIESGILPRNTTGSGYLFYDANRVYSSDGIDGSGTILAVAPTVYESSAPGAIISTLGL